MADIFFFTDYSLLDPTQGAYDNFGPISSDPTNKYNVTSLHSATIANVDPTCYAVCDGRLRYQIDNTDSSLLNIVFIPDNLPIIGIPIRYFIYRGVLRSSLIDSENKILPKDTNSVTTIIQNNQEASNTLLKKTDLPNINALGIGFSASASDLNLLRTDSDTIESLFFDTSKYRQITVKAGDTLGKFSKTKFGFEIILGGLALEPTLDIVRNKDVDTGNRIDISISGLSANQIKKTKETVLNYLDPCAFFSNFYRSGIKPINSTSGSLLKEYEYFDKVFRKFTNKNRTYLDIKNENGFSLNYYENYGNDIKTCYNTDVKHTDVSTTTYTTHGWPIKIIEGNEFTSNTHLKTAVRVSLPVNGNTKNLVFLSHAPQFSDKNKKGVIYSKFPRFPKIYEGTKRFVTLQRLEIDGEIDSAWTSELLLSTHNVHDTLSDSYTALSQYFRIYYIRQQESSPTTLDSTIVTTTEYLDNLFNLQALTSYKKWENLYPTKYWLTGHEKYIESKEGFLKSDAMVQTGVAFDANRITFFAIPIQFVKRITPQLKIKPIIGGTSVNESFFQTIHDGIGENLKLQKNTVELSAGNYITTLRYQRNSSKSEDIKNNGANTIKPYDEESIIAVSFSKQEYAIIENSLSTSGFDTNLHPIFLQLNTLNNNNTDYTIFDFKLAGYNSNGKVQFINLPSLPSSYSGKVDKNTKDGKMICTNSAAQFEPLDVTEILGIEIDHMRGTPEYEYIKMAIEDVKMFNKPLYDSVMEKINYGYTHYYPQETNPRTEKFRILVKFGELQGEEAGGETAIDSEHGYFPKAVNPNSTDEDSRQGLSENRIVNYSDYLSLYHLKPTEIATQFQPIFNLRRIDGNGDVLTSLQSAIRLGYGVLNPATPITITLNKFIIDEITKAQHEAIYISDEHVKDFIEYQIPVGTIKQTISVEYIFKKDYTLRRQAIGAILAHELGHADYEIANPLLFYCWNKLEKQYPNNIGPGPLYINFGNGHLRGNPTGNRACSSEFIFRKKIIAENINSLKVEHDEAINEKRNIAAQNTTPLLPYVVNNIKFNTEYCKNNVDDL